MLIRKSKNTFFSFFLCSFFHFFSGGGGNKKKFFEKKFNFYNNYSFPNLFKLQNFRQSQKKMLAKFKYNEYSKRRRKKFS